MISSEEKNYFTVYLNQLGFNLSLFNISTLTDTVSLVCGDGTGISYCGKRELIIWDNDLNQQHSLIGSNLFSLSGTSLII